MQQSFSLSTSNWARHCPWASKNKTGRTLFEQKHPEECGKATGQIINAATQGLAPAFQTHGVSIPAVSLTMTQGSEMLLIHTWEGSAQVQAPILEVLILSPGINPYS